MKREKTCTNTAHATKRKKLAFTQYKHTVYIYSKYQNFSNIPNVFHARGSEIEPLAGLYRLKIFVNIKLLDVTGMRDLPNNKKNCHFVKSSRKMLKKLISL